MNVLNMNTVKTALYVSVGVLAYYLFVKKFADKIIP